MAAAVRNLSVYRYPHQTAKNRFSLGCATREPLRGGTQAGGRAGERKACWGVGALGRSGDGRMLFPFWF